MPANKSKKDRVIIFDTTLRDGEQSPGISLDTTEKLEIAEQLENLGVDIIEAGFPVASQGDFEAVYAISKVIHNSIICGLSRTAHQDIDRCYEAIEPATKKRIHTFIATSETHMKHKLRMTPEEVKKEAASAVKKARSYVEDVEFSPEDASRSDFDFMCEVLQIAVDNGATTLNIPDTVGYGIPEEYAKRIATIREKVKGDYVISTHCHNDLGLAVANSLAGVQAGARQIECAINGIGERAGNAALEEVVMAIKTRSDFYTDLEVDIKTEELQKASRLVSQLTGYPVQYNKAVVGRNAFAHEAGIHQHGVLRERTTYEIMDPKMVGQGESKLVLGKHSGRAAFADHLEKAGIKIHGDALNSAFLRFKELADKKVEITEADIEALATDELVSTVDDIFQFKGFKCTGGSEGEPHAEITITIEGKDITKTGSGSGMIDATCTAIKEATGIKGKLTDYSVSSVTGGVDAQANVGLQFTSEDGIKTSAYGLSTDVVEASAMAFLKACNKVERIRRSGENPALVDRPGHLS